MYYLAFYYTFAILLAKKVIILWLPGIKTQPEISNREPAHETRCSSSDQVFIYSKQVFFWGTHYFI